MEGLCNNEANRSNNIEIKIHIKKMTLLEVSALKGPTKGIVQFFYPYDVKKKKKCCFEGKRIPLS